jgi:hypothetical protein
MVEDDRRDRTHRTLPRESRRCRPLQTRYFTHILGKARVQNGYQTGTQRELQVPTITSLQANDFNFSQRTYMRNAQVNLSSFSFVVPLHIKFKCTFHFLPVNKTVCPLECAALMS